MVHQWKNFFYADDLNNHSTETTLWQLLIDQTPAEIYPRNATWVRCHSLTNIPHSNECGPHTILALAIIASHLNPHSCLLLPYMHTNLGYFSRIWMGTLLLTRTVPLMKPSLQTSSPCNKSTLSSTPKTLIQWDRPEAMGVTITTNRGTHKMIDVQSPLKTFTRSITSSHQIRNDPRPPQIKTSLGTPGKSSQQHQQQTGTLPQVVPSKLCLATPKNITCKQKQIQLTLHQSMDLPKPPDKMIEGMWGHYPN